MASEDIERIGGLIHHAEELQKRVEQLAAAGQASGRNINSLVKQASDVVGQLKTISEGLGAQAAQGGAEAVASAIERELKSVSERVSGMVFESASSTVDLLRGSIDDAREAGQKLDSQFRGFQKRAIGAIAVCASASVVIAAVTFWTASMWVKREIAGLYGERDRLVSEIAYMKDTEQEMTTKGLKIDLRQCRAADGALRDCIAVEPNTEMATLNGVTYFVPKGY